MNCFEIAKFNFSFILLITEISKDKNDIKVISFVELANKSNDFLLTTFKGKVIMLFLKNLYTKFIQIFSRLLKNKVFFAFFIWFVVLNWNKCLRHIINIFEVVNPTVIGLHHITDKVLWYVGLIGFYTLIVMALWKLFKFYLSIKFSK